jgi:O-antigen/teichoic acid export membrane protein
MKSLKNKIFSFPPLATFKMRLTKSHLTERFSKGVFWTLMGNIVWRFLSAASSIAVARILGARFFGEFGMIYSTVNMFSVYAGFQLRTTTTKYVSEHRENDPDKAGRILKLTFAAGHGKRSDSE